MTFQTSPRAFKAASSILLFTLIVFFGAPWLGLPQAESQVNSGDIRELPVRYGAAVCKTLFAQTAVQSIPYGAEGPPKRDGHYEWFPENRMIRLNNMMLEGRELSVADLRFLYEIDEPFNFNLIKDGVMFGARRVLLRNWRKERIREDLATALEVKPSEISLTLEEALRGGIKFHYGDLEVTAADFEAAKSRLGPIRRRFLSRLTGRTFRLLPEVVIGSMELRNFPSFENVILPDSIMKNLTYIGSYNFNELVPPRYVRGRTSARIGSNVSIFAGSVEIL